MRRAAVALAFVLLAACTDSGSPTVDPAPSDDSTSTSTTTSTTAAAPVEAIKLTEVAQADKPTAMAVRKDDPALYVTEKTGKVRKIVNGRVESAAVLDVSGDLSSGFEQGLLGLAFSPDGRYLYVNYTDAKGDTRIAEKDMTSNGPLRELLFVDQPYPNHNGGQLAFGRDGHLYIALGDGGAGNDPQGNGQKLDTLLGKILRISPRPDGGRPYGIPADNPFVGQPGKRGEIWAYGLRNPWRFSFDRQTGDLWIADVGQGKLEEIDFDEAPLDAGRNYEWALREGSARLKGERPPGGVPPVHEYGHDQGGCSVTGGYAYRGKALRGWEGAYFFADYCVARLQVLRNGKAEDVNVKTKNVASFGEDAAGELYVLSLDGPIYRIDPA